MKSRKRSGFALLAVLGLVSVLVMMVAALLGTNRSTFALLRYTQAKNRMDRTIETVYSFCQYRLEHDFTWGQSPFAGQVSSYQGLQLTELARGSGATQRLVGSDEHNHTQFLVDITNNLNGEVSLIEEAQTGQVDGVPVGFCRLNIVVERSGKLEGAMVMVRHPGLVGAGLLANGDLSLDSANFNMYSKDPLKNQTRSKGNTMLTGMSDFFFNPAQPAPGAPHIDSENPVMWAGGETRFRLTESATYQDRDAFQAANGGQQLQQGRFKDQSQARFEVPDVGLGDVAQVTTPDGATKPVRQLHGGIYEFQQYTIGGHLVRVLARRTTDSSQPLREQNGPIDRFWYTSDTGSVSPAEVAGAIGAPGAAGTHTDVQYAELDVDGAMVDLIQRRVVLDDTYNFEVSGDFGLRSGGDLADRIKPSLFFAHPEDLGDGQVNYQFSEDAEVAEQEGRNDDRGSLRASGQIQLDGDISGSATIAGGGDVSLAPTRFYDGNGNTTVDFSIFSEGDIELIPPNLIEDKDNRDGDASDIAGSHIGPDGEIIHREFTNISQNELVFTGLLYARGSVTFDMRDTQQEQQLRDLSIEGAVVARGGDLSIQNSNKFNITYNPKFVDRLLPNLYQDGQHRIEVTGWRDTRPTTFSP